MYLRSTRRVFSGSRPKQLGRNMKVTRFATTTACGEKRKVAQIVAGLELNWTTLKKKKGGVVFIEKSDICAENIQTSLALLLSYV